MKGAAKCDFLVDCITDSVHRLFVERRLLLRYFRKSMFVLVSFVFLRDVWFHVFVFVCLNVFFVALAHVSWWCWTCASSHMVCTVHVKMHFENLHSVSLFTVAHQVWLATGAVSRSRSRPARLLFTRACERLLCGEHPLTDTDTEGRQ